MLRPLEDVEHETLLDELAGPQQGHAVGHLCHDAHVVGDEDDRGAELSPQFAHQLEDLGLHGHVERRRGLVRDQHLGLARQGHADHHALAHAARKLVRILAHAARRLGDMDGIEHRPGPRLGAGPLGGPVLADGLRHLGPDRHHRVQRRHGLLEDHGHVAAPQGPDGASGQAREFAPLQPDRTLAHFQRGGQEPHDRESRQRLAGTGFAREAQGFPGRERQTDVLQHGPQTFGGPRVDAQILDREHRPCCRPGCHSKTMRGK